MSFVSADQQLKESKACSAPNDGVPAVRSSDPLLKRTT